MTQVSKARSTANKPQEFVSIKEFEGSGDGITKNDTALASANAALPSGATLIFPEDDAGVYLFDTDVQITRSDITYKGNVIWKSSTAVAGNSAVASVTGSQSNVIFDGIRFDANAQRRWGLHIADTCADCCAVDTDSFHHTDVEGIGIKVAGDTYVTLRDPEVVELSQMTAITLTAGGSLPQPNVFRVFPVGVDALGREGSANVPSDATTQRTTDATNKSIAVTFKTVSGARSYRLYLQDKDVVQDWQRYYGVPVPVGDPSTISYTVSANWAGKPALPTVSQVTGTFQGLVYRPYFFRIAAYYSDGQGNHSGNSDGFVWSTINDAAKVIRLTWSAPAGATPTGYKIFVSTADTGGPRNFEWSIDVGNVTTYDFDGSETFIKEFPYGNSDEVVAFGGRERNLTGYGKAILNGETFQSHSKPGTDNTYQFQYVAAAAEASTPGATSRNGLQWRKQYDGDSTTTVEWDMCQYGNGKPIYIWNLPTAVAIASFNREGFATHSQTEARVYLNAIVSNVTGDDTTYTVLFDQIDKNVGSPYTAGTGLFTAPIAADYRFRSELLVSVGAATTQLEVKLNRSVGTDVSSSREDITTNKNHIISIDRTLSLAAGETVKVDLRGSGEASAIHDIISSAGRESFLDVRMI